MSQPGRITIRPMMETDLDAVLAIEQASFSSPWKKDHFRHELEAAHSFPLVGLLDGKLAGYVCLMSLFEEAQILDIAVDPAWRGQGVALQLMEQAISLALEKGAEVLALEVRTSSIPAITLYERLGFSRTGIRPRYYDGKEDALLMEKTLNRVEI
ncbi:ribosomal protein S18-alanine N-acetyltransferase [Pelotalea chapellei]|uniref:[Ribosomal protein bS18]-alanine N-acetyltransferase n=1 Tax=Pelotalea chapellei TaxID=44671 RepID=A0ABS5UC70_9BACT|nr:ribosomal protein S18-alanine N-acetyltransferase [Pelotalea chapellei]MBT1073081.1 ribosomal protein S18-alanine N-acetyltransferase [Pelotalea chapellei]